MSVSAVSYAKAISGIMSVPNPIQSMRTVVSGTGT